MLISTLSGSKNGQPNGRSPSLYGSALGCVGCGQRLSRPFGGALGGAADITSLQQALTAYAMGSGNGSANPCSTNGNLDKATLQALTYVALKIPGIATVTDY